MILISVLHRTKHYDNFVEIMYHNLVYNDILFIVNSVLIEKILRTEPDVGKMYLLIKAKNKEAAMERLQNEVFLFFMLYLSKFMT